MEAKYYTPEIEEFHVGFEFEYETNNSMPFLDDTLGKWKKSIFSASCYMDGECERQDIEELIKKNQIRVKHLDREDIESLSWIPLTISEENSSWVFKNKKNEYNCRLILDSRNKDAEFTILNKNLRIVFQGTIKNKSELQKLMKQLNIK